MPRSLWSGALSFGLVTVPVKIVTAVRDKDIHFHQVHEADGGRIHHKRVCSADGKEVEYDEIGKVYEEHGPPVMLLPEELESVEAEKGDTIDILDFVKMAEVDPLYFEKPYYLVPDKGGDKAYRLLVEAMRKTGNVAIASFVFRSKEKLAIVRPLAGALTLTMLSWSDEVMLPEDIDGIPGKARANKKELEMAEALIEQLTGTWDPKRYKDEHRERVLDLIEAKRKGGILLPMPKAKREATSDLLAALEESIKHHRKARA